ncbi:hypothetical protein GCM10023094_39930 [Rhodococcus olei]|uniref:Uncharacterized protein n=1 Tax=Rhodococcus olei TaxID=2161675 RepID=A0ABP8PEI7_9NOCA
MQAWESRGSEADRAALEQRVLVRIAIAEAAGVDPRHEVERIEITETGGYQRRGRRRRGAAAAAGSESQQLAIW